MSLTPYFAQGETFEVKMLNGNATGGMVFEPDFLSLKPGDKVKFLATQRGHNAATVKDFLPAGATSFKGKINQEIEVTFTEEGFYGIMCTSHYDMGMVMVVRVGETPTSEMKPPKDVRLGAAKHFTQIVERNQYFSRGNSWSRSRVRSIIENSVSGEVRNIGALFV